MRLESVLFAGNLIVKSVSRQGNVLVMETDPDTSVPGSLYIDPGDVLHMIKRLLTPSVMGYMLFFPFYYWKWKKNENQVEKMTEPW